MSPVWEKLKILSIVISSLAVPVVLAVLGNSWTGSQKKQEIAVRYVELATNILRTEPSEQTKSLRIWSIAVIDHYSEVPLSESARQELELQQLDVVPGDSLLRGYKWKDLLQIGRRLDQKVKAKEPLTTVEQSLYSAYRVNLGIDPQTDPESVIYVSRKPQIPGSNR